MKIQELLRKEVMSYRKPQPIDFGALITPKSAGTSQVDDDPYADLNAFLAQLASPVKEDAPSTSAANPLLAGSTSNNKSTTNSLLAANLPASTQQTTSNSLLQSQPTNPLLAGAAASQRNPLLDSQASKPSNPLLTQTKSLPFQKSNKHPLLFGSTKSNPLLGSNFKNDVKSEQDGEEQQPAVNVVVTTTSESDQSNDTELFNSFIRNHAKGDTETSEPLTINTVVKTSSDDIEMISAKLKQTELTEETTDKPDEETEAKVQDTKSILRQRLIDKQNASSGMLYYASEF